jgi:hypothetical protein
MLDSIDNLGSAILLVGFPRAWSNTPEILIRKLLRNGDVTISLLHKHQASHLLEPSSTCNSFSLRPDEVHLFDFGSLNSKNPTISSDSL